MNDAKREKIYSTNNRAIIAGALKGPLTFYYRKNNERFFKGYILSKRKSEVLDEVPVVISERILPKDFRVSYTTGTRLYITGQFRSYLDKKADGSSKLDLYVFAITCEKAGIYQEDRNSVFFKEAFICKEPIYRITPKSRKRIADAMIAVNREDGESDYIPSIAWDDNAYFVGIILEVGDKISIDGRIHSRPYTKHKEDGTYEDKVAYELSIGFILKE